MYSTYFGESGIFSNYSICKNNIINKYYLIIIFLFSPSLLFGLDLNKTKECLSSLHSFVFILSLQKQSHFTFLE
ncbi:hypothetical protein P8452_49921 [Trifolium repens]|nr:hypothetical protein P8452_49921 [Trifolium repens]